MFSEDLRSCIHKDKPEALIYLKIYLSNSKPASSPKMILFPSQLLEYDCCIDKICILYPTLYLMTTRLQAVPRRFLYLVTTCLTVVYSRFNWKKWSHFFIKDKKCGLHQTCKTVEWPHRLLRNPRDEPLRSRLNDVLGAFMIAFLWNCFWLQQPSCVTAAWWQRKWNFSVTAWTPWSSVSFADVDCQAQLSTIILCYTMFATWAC